jgi:hypothetical protein
MSAFEVPRGRVLQSAPSLIPLGRIDARFPASRRTGPPRGVVVALLMLAVAAFTAETLSLGAWRHQPRYDEVSYLQVARDYHRMGGAAAAVRCHLDGLCREDNRFPTYVFLLQTFASDLPEFFADAKLFTLATAFLLLAVVAFVAWRISGPAAAVISVLLMAFMPTLNEIASGVLADVLFACALLVAVRAIGLALDRGARWWVGAGALVGVAYLTKGNGHLAILALMTAGLTLHGPRLFVTARPYAAVTGFVAVAFFLLWRNVIDYDGNPFHNFNDRSIWLDSWQETLRLVRSAEWRHIGLAWYLRRHSLFALGWRLLKGLAQTLGALCYTSGLGITAGTPSQLSTSIPGAIIRLATGAVLMALAACGLRDRHRGGHRAEILTALHASGWLIFAFAIGGQGVGGVATRFMLPLVAIGIPYASSALVEHVWPRVRPAYAVGVVTLLLGIKFATFADGVTKNPRRAFEVPPDWRETSAWLAQHLEPGERYAFPYGSLYSTWDHPAPDPDARWPYDYGEVPSEMLAAIAEARPLSVQARWDGSPRPIRKIFVDMADHDLRRFRSKLSEAGDAHGPLIFLGWPRCFADSGRPSRFLIYCR